MRHYVTSNSDARVLLGGKLRGYRGSIPGVIEEAILAVTATQPLCVAGGFGGAATAANALDPDQTTWHPPDLPEGADECAEALPQLVAAAAAHPLVADGLSQVERRQLGATHRPGDIASLVVNGLGRLATRN